MCLRTTLSNRYTAAWSMPFHLGHQNHRFLKSSRNLFLNYRLSQNHWLLFVVHSLSFCAILTLCDSAIRHRIARSSTYHISWVRFTEYMFRFCHLHIVWSNLSVVLVSLRPRVLIWKFRFATGTGILFRFLTMWSRHSWPYFSPKTWSASISVQFLRWNERLHHIRMFNVSMLLKVTRLLKTVSEWLTF